MTPRLIGEYFRQQSRRQRGCPNQRLCLVAPERCRVSRQRRRWGHRTGGEKFHLCVAPGGSRLPRKGHPVRPTKGSTNLLPGGAGTAILGQAIGVQPHPRLVIAFGLPCFWCVGCHSPNADHCLCDLLRGDGARIWRASMRYVVCGAVILACLLVATLAPTASGSDRHGKRV